MFQNIDNTVTNIEFISGEFLEIYLPEEQVDYRFQITSDCPVATEEHLVLHLPDKFKNTFYKGEDFIQCRYVLNNILYEFGSEIVKIVHGPKCFVILKKPSTVKKSSSRSTYRISTNIVSEYFVEQVVIGQPTSRMQGFSVIRDANIGGVSFLTQDILPINTIIRMELERGKIQILVQVKKAQMINEKYFYGARITGFVNCSEDTFKRYLDSLSKKDDNDNYYPTIY